MSARCFQHKFQALEMVYVGWFGVLGQLWRFKGALTLDIKVRGGERQFLQHKTTLISLLLLTIFCLLKNLEIEASSVNI